MLDLIDNKVNMKVKNRLVSGVFFLLALLAIYPPQCFFCFFPQTLKLVYRLLFIFAIFVFYLRKVIIERKVDFFIIIMSVFSVFQIFSTFYNHEYIYAAIYQNTLITIGGLMLLDLLFANGYKYAIKILLVYFSFFTILNLIINTQLEGTVFFDPWLMGRRTAFILFFIPLVFINFLYDYIYKNKLFNIKTIAIFIIIFITTFIDFSSTLLCLEVFSILLGTYILTSNKFKIDIKIYLIVYFAIFFIFVFPGTNGVFTKYVCFVLGKNQQASDRLPIYDAYKDVIANRGVLLNIIGNGFLRPEKYRAITHTYVLAHNILIQVLYDFGIIGLIFLVFEIVFISFVTNKQKVTIKQLLQLFFFVMLMRSTYDSYSYYDWVFNMGLIYNLSGKVFVDIKNLSIKSTIVEYN